MAQSPDVSFTKLSKSIWVTSGAPTGFSHDCHVTTVHTPRNPPINEAKQKRARVAGASPSLVSAVLALTLKQAFGSQST